MVAVVERPAHTTLTHWLAAGAEMGKEGHGL